MKLLLKVHYPNAYPDVLPELSLEPVDGEFEDEELDALVADMESVVRRSFRCSVCGRFDQP